MVRDQRIDGITVDRAMAITAGTAKFFSTFFILV
jgi:hypothetical protein